MIGGVVGHLTLLLALVHGLLIWTAYGVYNTQQTELQTIAARALEFDLEMRQYGPEGGCRPRAPADATSSGRTSSSGATTHSRAAAYEASYKAMGNLNKFFDGLEPKTPGADESARRRARELRLHRRAAAPHVAAGGDAGPLAADLRGDLLVLPDVRQHGAFVEIEPDVGAMLVLGSASIGLAIFLILEFSKPYTGSTPRFARAARTGDPRPRPAAAGAGASQ